MQPLPILIWQQRLKAYTKTHSISQVQLAELLQLKPRALQRRFAGHTSWSLAEYIHATQLLGLPPIPEPNTIRMQYQNLPGELGFDESAYLANLEAAAEPLFKHKGHIEVASTDIPMFYLIDCPHTLRAKCMVFAGGKALSVPFSSSFIARCTRLKQQYLSIPRREIWGIHPLMTLMNQLDYLFAIRLLKPRDLSKIYEELSKLFASLETRLLDRETGLQLRHDDLRVTATMYRVVPDGIPGVTYMSYDNPNAFATADIESNRWFAKHFEYLWHRTTAIDSARPIQHYFGAVQVQLAQRIEQLEARLEDE